MRNLFDFFDGGLSFMERKVGIPIGIHSDGQRGLTIQIQVVLNISKHKLHFSGRLLLRSSAFFFSREI